MKKSVLILTIIFSLSLLFAFTYAVEMPLRVVVNGDEIYFPDAQPFIDANGRTQTPARFIAEALGASVTWDGEARKATFEKDSNKLVLFIDKKEYELNGVKKQMDTAAIIKENRTFVPARYVAEAFGATVSWDGAIRTVYIDLKEAVNPTPTPTPTPTPQDGTVKYYDGIAFNNVTDVDEYSRMSVEKSKEFLLKLASQLTFVKENGKYYIKCTYPALPEGHRWLLSVEIDKKDGSYKNYSTITARENYKLPDNGSFTKIVTEVTNASDVECINIVMSIHTMKKLEFNMDPETAVLNIITADPKQVNFIPNSASKPVEEIKNFDYNSMFKW